MVVVADILVFKKVVLEDFTGWIQDIDDLARRVPCEAYYPQANLSDFHAVTTGMRNSAENDAVSREGKGFQVCIV